MKLEKIMTVESEDLTVSSPEMAADFLKRNYNDAKQEIFTVSLLDGKQRIFASYIVSKGSSTRTVVHPRDVFREACTQNAMAIIVSHNHPSGTCLPSREDMETTKTLRKGGDILGIKVLDHIIISSQGYFSFLEKGMMED